MAEEIKVGDWISYRMSGLAGRAAKRALGRHRPSRKDLGGPKKIAVAPEEATLIEAQWSLIGPLLPPRRDRVGRPLHDHRRVRGGILWVARTGCSWRDCPRSTLTSRLLTDDGGLGKSGVCGSVSFGRWDGKSYPDRRPNLTSDALRTVQRIEKVTAWPNRAEAANYGS